MRERPVAGVELGGTKCIAILGRGPADILSTETIPTSSPRQTLGALRSILQTWYRTERFDHIGIGCFGPLDLANGTIAATPKAGWRDTAVLAELSRGFDVPASLDTDVTGAALAEGRWGSAQGLESYAYITVGTGIGAGIIANNRPVGGLGHAEAGHIRVRRVPGDAWPGSCPFHSDCAEGLASGTAISTRLGGSGELAGPDDPIWQLVADALGQLIHSIALIASPSKVVLGGGVINSRPHLLGLIREALGTSLAGYCAPLLSSQARAEFVTTSTLSDKVGPLGALAIALRARV